MRVNRSATPKVANHQGQTALMLAAERGMYSLVRRLLHCHISTTSVDCEGRSAIRYALKWHFWNWFILEQRKM